jgi:hypothetical protein
MDKATINEIIRLLNIAYTRSETKKLYGICRDPELIKLLKESDKK